MPDTRPPSKAEGRCGHDSDERSAFALECDEGGEPRVGVDERGCSIDRVEHPPADTLRAGGRFAVFLSQDTGRGTPASDLPWLGLDLALDTRLVGAVRLRRDLEVAEESGECDRIGTVGHGQCVLHQRPNVEVQVDRMRCVEIGTCHRGSSQWCRHGWRIRDVEVTPT